MESLGAHLRNLLSPYKTLLQLVKYGKADEETIRKYNLDNLDELIAFSNSEAMEQEPASEDLEAALKAKVDEELKDPVFGKLINTFAAYAFAKQIVNWHKEQMMKGAIEGRLGSTVTGSEQYVSAYVGYGEYGKDGDKVKVIIIKE